MDAQLPRRLAHEMNAEGWDARHTLDLDSGNQTSDAEITRIADEESRAVVTKDADFVASHLVTGAPRRLLLVSTGNLTNSALSALVMPRLGEIERAFADAAFVEITPTLLVVHA